MEGGSLKAKRRNAGPGADAVPADCARGVVFGLARMARTRIAGPAICAPGRS